MYKKDCELCNGTGTYYMPDGQDDVSPEICDCDNEELVALREQATKHFFPFMSVKEMGEFMKK